MDNSQVVHLYGIVPGPPVLCIQTPQNPHTKAKEQIHRSDSLLSPWPIIKASTRGGPMLSRRNNFCPAGGKKRELFSPIMYIRAALAKSSITAENFLDPQAALSRFFFPDLLRDGFQFAEAVVDPGFAQRRVQHFTQFLQTGIGILKPEIGHFP